MPQSARPATQSPPSPTEHEPRAAPALGVSQRGLNPHPEVPKARLDGAPGSPRCRGWLWVGFRAPSNPTQPSLHGTTGRPELEGAFEGHLVPLPCNKQGPPQLQQVRGAPSPDPGVSHPPPLWAMTNHPTLLINEGRSGLGGAALRPRSHFPSAGNLSPIHTPSSCPELQRPIPGGAHGHGGPWGLGGLSTAESSALSV